MGGSRAKTQSITNLIGAPTSHSLHVQVRMEGTWNSKDSFLLGLMAPDSHCLNESHGFDACDVGYWSLGTVVQCRSMLFFLQTGHPCAIICVYNNISIYTFFVLLAPRNSGIHLLSQLQPIKNLSTSKALPPEFGTCDSCREYRRITNHHD